jgi:hypothetical protein
VAAPRVEWKLRFQPFVAERLDTHARFIGLDRNGVVAVACRRGPTVCRPPFRHCPRRRRDARPPPAALITIPATFALRK